MAQILRTINKKINVRSVIKDVVVALILAYLTYEYMKNVGYIAC